VCESDTDAPTGDLIPDNPQRLPEREQAILDEISDVFGGAREIVGPLPPGRVLERVEGHGIVVEFVAVEDEEFDPPACRREGS
jgi:hypothetical protein